MAYKHASVHTHDSLKRVMEASAHLVTPLKCSSKATLESFSCLRLEFGDNKRSARLILQMIKLSPAVRSKALALIRSGDFLQRGGPLGSSLALQ